MARTAKGMNSVAIRNTKCWTIRSVARRIHSGRNNAHRTKQLPKSDAINEHSRRTNWSKTLLGSARKRDRQGNPNTPNSKPIKRQAIRPFISVGRKSLESESTRKFPSPLGCFLEGADRRDVLRTLSRSSVQLSFESNGCQAIVALKGCPSLAVGPYRIC